MKAFLQIAEQTLRGITGLIQSWLVMLFFDGICSIVIMFMWNVFATRNGLPTVLFFDVWIGLFIVDFTLKSLK